jgi:hypothetical protein
MANTDRDLPAANRADSEIAFMLRRTKWRRGPDVLRDVARAESTRRQAKSETTAEPERKRSGGRTAI